MQSRRFRPVTLAAIGLAASIALGACGGGASATPGASGGALEGRTFLSTVVEGRALVAGTTIRLTFQGGHVSASAGCNSMGGAYRIDGDRLIVGQLASTEMACAAALMEQDRWVADLLNGSTLALDDNTLTVTKAAIRLTLLDRVVADPDRPLLGTRWVLETLINGGTASSIPAGVVAALTFTDGQVRVEAGCNEGGGAVTITAATIEFGSIVLTKMACAPAAMAVERAVSVVLSGTVGYAIQAGTLTVDGGATGLSLRAVP